MSEIGVGYVSTDEDDGTVVPMEPVTGPLAARTES